MQRRSKLRIFNRRACVCHFAEVHALESRLLMWAADPIATPPISIVPIRGGGINSPALVPNVSAPYAPSDVQAAYGINSISFSGVSGTGAGQTIAIIDAYNDPNIIPDTATFDTRFGLPQFNTAGNPTFSVLNQTGGASLPANATSGNWDLEMSMDVQWAHAIAPMANIILFEANSAFNSDLYATVTTAAHYSGVSVVSMSFGSSEWSLESFSDSEFTTPSGHQGVTFLASTGDAGAPAAYPAYSPNVVAVGGTSLSINSDGSYGSESAWSGGGGGISAYENQPIFQSGKVNGLSSTMRTAPDVSLLADPNTGVLVYDSWASGANNGGYDQVGGTSLSCPMWAGLIAIADQGRVINGLGTLDGATQTLPMLYQLSSSDFHDVTSGSNGFSAGTGYDLATGLGTPIANLLVPALAGMAQTVSVINDATAGDTITLTKDKNQLYIDWTTGTASGQFAIANPTGLTITGTGSSTIQFNYANGNPVPPLLSLNGTFTLAGLQGTNPLAGTELNINSSTLFVTYSVGSDPISAMRQYLATGYNGGLWNGAPVAASGSIVSSTAAIDSAQQHAIGYIDSADGSGFNSIANSIELKYTLYGDTALLGTVGFVDFMRLTQHYGMNNGGAWDTGDFNYDGSVGSTDFSLLSRCFGLSLATLPGPAPASAATTTTSTITDAGPGSSSPPVDDENNGPSAGVVDATPARKNSSAGRRVGRHQTASHL